MKITSVNLTNFRNHSQYHLDCRSSTSLILGSNGWGKTSILEAIYIASQGKSFRATDTEIVKYQTDFYRIEIQFSDHEKRIVTYDGKTKTFILADKKNKRLPTQQKIPIVLFLPSDLNFINHSPSYRRNYFDHVFTQLNPLYHQQLLKYDKALKQRNALLKNSSLNPKTLFSWNILLAKYGLNLFCLRQQFIKLFNQSLTKTYRTIAKNRDQIDLLYQSDLFQVSNDQYLQILEDNFQKDLLLGHTSFGIHRDDYLLQFNTKPAQTSASRGETRSMILSLKFIEANLIEQKLNTKPLILLDDVFSELDQTRRQCLVKNFQNNQVFITSVEDVID